ncbi:hypothetical protein GCM10022210_25040 [Mucilaginibacter dorajii]|uniref:Uncharacterized protein n=2 Tax=Mucilaginibacter dorajii TaxID=692994 RepID=A0ABP7PZ80_9SPHI
MISRLAEGADKNVKEKNNNCPIPDNNTTTMNFQSKKISLVILGVTAILCSRTLFFFFNDTEGPNLLIVGGLAVAIYLLAFAAYVFVPSKKQGLKKLSIAVCIQILSVIGLYFCMK